MSYRSTLKEFIPPILLKARHTLFPKTEGTLFDGDDALFKQLIAGAAVYGEYGVGKSTIWAHNNAQCSILSVDTDPSWIEGVKDTIGTSNRLKLEWVDLGDVGEWGRPNTYARRDKFNKYVESIWVREKKPDLVLIDGRFRICCFLYSLATAPSGTKILFDDYVSRPHYHVVEEYLKPDQFCGRQAQFTVPNHIDREIIKETAKRFLYVME